MLCSTQFHLFKAVYRNVVGLADGPMSSVLERSQVSAAWIIFASGDLLRNDCSASFTVNLRLRSQHKLKTLGFFAGQKTVGPSARPTSLQ